MRLGGGGYQAAIDDLKTQCMDPDFEERYKELLRQVVMDEVRIKHKERLDELEENIVHKFHEVKEALVNPDRKTGVESNQVIFYVSVRDLVHFL